MTGSLASTILGANPSTKDAMQIEPLVEKDFAAWKPLWEAYLAFYKTELPEDATKLAFLRLIDPAEPMGGFIARNEAGAAQGVAHWIDHRSCWTAGNYCYLQDLFVASEIRGQGVGAGLIEAVSAAARQRACSRVYWITHETNVKAQGLYNKLAERSGFIQYVKKLD
jgi:GNAT superfamily N-acetyltransferase